MVLILYFFWGYTLNKLVYLSKPKQAIFSLSRAGISGKKGPVSRCWPKGGIKGIWNTA